MSSRLCSIFERASVHLNRLSVKGKKKRGKRMESGEGGDFNIFNIFNSNRV